MTSTELTALAGLALSWLVTISATTEPAKADILTFRSDLHMRTSGDPPAFQICSTHRLTMPIVSTLSVVDGFVTAVPTPVPAIGAGVALLPSMILESAATASPIQELSAPVLRAVPDAPTVAVSSPVSINSMSRLISFARLAN